MKLLEIMFAEYGLKEIPGEINNPRIVNFANEIGSTWVQNDEVAWCGIFMIWAAKQVGLERAETLDARSWLDVGLKIDEPQLGDIVILWREAIHSWKGHVGVYINHNKTSVYLLGGNQNNSVCIRPYLIDRVLGYRRLRNLS